MERRIRCTCRCPKGLGDVKKWRIFFIWERMCDLFMKAIRQEAWINLYKDKDGRLFPGLILFESEKEAKDRTESGEKSSRLYCKTVKIEWEE